MTNENAETNEATLREMITSNGEAITLSMDLQNQLIWVREKIQKLDLKGAAIANQAAEELRIKLRNVIRATELYIEKYR